MLAPAATLVISTPDPRQLLQDCAAADPGLPRRLATADHRREDFLALEDWLLSLHGVSAEAEPALAASRLDRAGRGHGWLRIDALSLVISRDRLVALPQQPGDTEDAAALIDAVLPHLPPLGTVHAAGTQRLLDLDATAEARFAPAWRTAGRPLDSHLPEGPRGAEWRRWLTEAQMLLHEHPLNQQREARGLRPLNALWLAGGVATAVTPRDAGVHLLGAHALTAVLPLRTDASQPGAFESRGMRASAPSARSPESDTRGASILVWLHRPLEMPPLEKLPGERPAENGQPCQQLPPEVAATLAQGAFSLRILEPSGRQCYDRRLWHALRAWRRPLLALAGGHP